MEVSSLHSSSKIVQCLINYLIVFTLMYMYIIFTRDMYIWQLTPHECFTLECVITKLPYFCMTLKYICMICVRGRVVKVVYFK
jgi:hypothetical protein